MLRPGVIFCPYCCRTHTTPFYTHGSRAVGVDLHYKNAVYGIVERRLPTSDGSDSESSTEALGLRLEAVEETVHAGMPAWVDVVFPGESDPVKMRRTCPHCFRMNDRPNLGTLPTLIVGMVGVRSSGKSALLNSIAYPPHQAAVNSENYPFLLDIAPLPHYQGLAAATPKLGRGMTKLLTVIHRKTNTPVAHVMLLDVSGELFGDARPVGVKIADDDVSMDELTKILSGTAGYPGVDAVLFADPVPGSKEIGKIDLKFVAADVMNQCLLLNPKFAQLPMAYVFTHLDHYKRSNYPTFVKDHDNSRAVPLMTATTFRDGSYAPERLVDRIFTEDTIARCLPSFVPMARSKQITKGFLVQSCSCENKEGIGLVEDYTYSRNVMDPLLWILNKLQVFPLTNGG